MTLAEINRQGADRAKAEVAELQAKLDKLQHRGFFARLFKKGV